MVDVNGMPNNYPLYVSPLDGAVKDQALTASCDPPAGVPPTPPGCSAATMRSTPSSLSTSPSLPGRRWPAGSAQTAPTIGDRLSGAGVDWAWYSGGWSNANGDIDAPGWTNGHGPTCSDPNALANAVFPNCPDKLFQFHHQAFNYYANYAQGRRRGPPTCATRTSSSTSPTHRTRPATSSR